ncbi:hypothetical protein [Albidovulum sp.]|uniref:hypothetical protein n=1 Tax=Albidovulum sp. TaxID=1872424 RepID=UPI001DBA0190|nr:hypothetical protein [Paracoccaceae bacterium]MCC0045374.1 hypothetical protein [Defluviimonas sp.]HPE25969.1 hypothetical protein [Albidovulum sp.]MCB2119883.1 hypothetical protein [Paracoccaceae bacterium]MCB2121651.1 hypothetical protein [Paracoccaceae bacterium]
MAELARLRHDEGVRLDPDALSAIYAELGERGAERLISRAMEDLAARLQDLRHCLAQGQRAQLVKSARMLGQVGTQVGMTSVSRVARDLIRVTEAGDMAAQAAVLARLERIGQRSLTAVWDLHDMTV